MEETIDTTAADARIAREQVRRVAIGIMGWHEGKDFVFHHAGISVRRDSTVSVSDGFEGYRREWNPLFDLSACREMEAAIIASGKGPAYIRQVVSMITEAEHAADNVWYASVDDWLKIATASAEQRGRAAIAMLEAEGKR